MANDPNKNSITTGAYNGNSSITSSVYTIPNATTFNGQSGHLTASGSSNSWTVSQWAGAGGGGGSGYIKFNTGPLKANHCYE